MAVCSKFFHTFVEKIVKMEKRLLIVMMICCLNSMGLWAQQWTEKDSVWLQNILSGKEKLELNPETMKAIQSGSFLNLGEPASNMKLATPDVRMQVLKDFSEYIQTDSTSRMALKDLPTYVFKKYGPNAEKMLPVLESIIEELKRDPLFGGHHGQATFSSADLTSRKGYVHNRNQKRNGTWQNYNNLPTPDIIKKRSTLSEEIKHPEKKESLMVKKESITQKKDSLCMRDSFEYKSPAQEFSITGLDTVRFVF